MSDTIGRMLCRFGFHAPRWGCPRRGLWCGRFTEAILGPDWERIITADRESRRAKP